MEREVIKAGFHELLKAEQATETQVTWVPLIVVLAIGIVGWIMAAVVQTLAPNVRDVVRRAGWVVVHLANYVTNIALMLWIAMASRDIATSELYLVILIPTHLLIGILCAYSALKSSDWKNWPLPSFLSLPFVVVVLGLMQGIQIKMVYDEYHLQKAQEEADDDAESQAAATGGEVPERVRGRYHLKAFDGVVEAFVFAAVALHMLLHTSRTQPLVPDTFLYATSFFCFLSAGLAMMEIDVRTSMSMQQVIQEASFNRIRHLAFRSAEFALRLLTALAFISFMSSHDSIVLGNMILIVDYLIGVGVLIHYGGHDPCFIASFILGIPLGAVNVMQFVDAPGMSMPAQSITLVMVPLRLLEMLVIVLLIVFIPGSSNLNPGRDNLLEEFEKDNIAWVVFAATAAFIYVCLLMNYGLRIKRSADLHTVVAEGDAEALERLLGNREVVLDVDRYGPDGKTPLHLAALRGQLKCMQLLVEHGANLQARTTIQNPLHSTTLHLAARSNDENVVRFLCSVPQADKEFLNATNADGDTALHIAAKQQHVQALQQLLQDARVDIKAKNHKGLTAAECAPSDKFGFDRNSPEHAIAELLRHAEFGDIERTTPKTIEMARVPSPSKSAGEGGGVGRMTTTRTDKSGGGGEPEGEPDAADSLGHEVPLMVMKPTEEAKFLQKQRGQKGSAGGSNVFVVNLNMGLSTFMLSAGLGALSFAFTSKVSQKHDDSSAVEHAEVTSQLDDFIELKPIGEGAFGKVVMVKHKETGEIFAMKLMEKAKFKAQKITRKAHSEQFILKTTRHPFIVSLHYAFQGQSFWALVMDLCPNGDLQKLLVDYGSPGLPYKEVARYCGEILLAIEHLHSIRVIFRDLKLENVVIDTKWRSRVTDFGLAKKLQTEADAKTMCGSYGYAAPEIMMNTGRYTYAVDLYSFGVMLYMMVSGGEESTKKKQRLPPVRHSSLRRKLREAEKNASLKWVAPEVGALELLMMLTADDAAARTTASKVKTHKFFETHLGRPVNNLLHEEGPFTPPQKPVKREERPSHRERSSRR